MPPAEYDATAKPPPTGPWVTVTARTLLRDLTIYPDRLDPAAFLRRPYHRLPYDERSDLVGL